MSYNTYALRKFRNRTEDKEIRGLEYKGREQVIQVNTTSYKGDEGNIEWAESIKQDERRFLDTYNTIDPYEQVQLSTQGAAVFHSMVY